MKKSSIKTTPSPAMGEEQANQIASRVIELLIANAQMCAINLMNYVHQQARRRR